jgi:hypothetical protein
MRRERTAAFGIRLIYRQFGEKAEGHKDKGIQSFRQSNAKA